MRSFRPVVWFGAAAVVLLVALVLKRPAVSDETATLLANRFWIERMPRDPRDQVLNAAWIARDGEQVGALGRSSNFRLRFELFGWRLEQNRLSMHFPQDDLRVDLEVRARRCQVQGFELCLELRGPRGEIRLFSREDWIIQGSDAPPELRALVDAAKAAPAISADCPRCSAGLPASLD
jgi:hypothetical protein